MLGEALADVVNHWGASLPLHPGNRKKNVFGFAGGGGSSEAAALAGLSVDAALNHWETAVAVHQANHPTCDHFLGDIFDTPPGEVLPGEAIAAARRRQVEALGYTPEADDAATTGELAQAGAAYAIAGMMIGQGYRGALRFRGAELWPWSMNLFKPRGRRENLVRAGALIVAELERLARAERTGAR